MKLESKYLNTDLDLRSSNNLSKLGIFFEKHAVLLGCQVSEDGMWHIRVEGKSSGSNKDANVDIADLLDAIDKMRSEHKKIWESCDKKEFNIGINCGETWAFSIFINALNVKRVSELGASIIFTTFPIKEESSCVV
ncbi:MAG: hypothetical protein R3F02_01130 [Thiolinea sp.]